MATGRFAPSPTGQLHLGNLRTALLAWLFARSRGGSFIVRMEDLDRMTSRPEHEQAQLADLAALGLDWDGEVVRQSERFERYDAAIATLTEAGLTYECYCTRREIREAAAAPHRSPGRYPGTCRSLSPMARAARRRERGRPAVRLRADPEAREVVHDELAGEVTGAVDDVVLRRNDGVPAYHVAVVVDDAAQGIEQVVRGDDLLASTPTQVHLARLLSLPRVSYAHVPLVLGPDHARLAKRHGPVSLADLAAQGMPAEEVRARLATSLGLAAPGERPSLERLLARFDPAALPRLPWVVSEADLGQLATPPR